jgi:hypothetical protein
MSLTWTTDKQIIVPALISWKYRSSILTEAGIL